MPTIAMFNGIIIRMFWEQGEPHNTPHIHAKYAEYEASFSIPEGEVIAGELPRRQTRIVQGWIAEHEEDLCANWQLAINNETPFKIEK